MDFHNEEQEQGMQATLVMYDSGTKGVWAFLVDRKGSTRYAAKGVAGRLKEAGYGGMRVTLKSDQEFAIIDLKRAVCVQRRSPTPLVESPFRESTSNGVVERASEHGSRNLGY